MIKQLKGNINQILYQNNLSKNLLELFNIQDVKNKFIDKVNSKQKIKFVEYLDVLDEILNSPPVIKKDFLNKIHKIKGLNKLGTSIIKDLTQNNRKEFYLLENWGQSEEYYVVLLREIQKIDWDVGIRIAKGLNCDELTENEYLLNNIKNKKGDFIFPQAAIKAPFLEHLIQKFFQNFGRIGITDHQFDLSDKLINNKIIQ